MESAVLLSTEETHKEMKKPLEVWHLIAAIAGVLIAAWGMIYMSTKDAQQSAKTVENHEVRISQLESARLESVQTFKDMNSKMDKLSEQNTQILIILQNKQDRK